MRAVFQNQLEQATFAQNGFVEMPLLSQKQVKNLLAAMHCLQPADAFAPQSDGQFIQSYHCSFLDNNQHYRRQALLLIEQAFAHVLSNILLDYRILSANFYVKPSGTGELPVHQNWPVLPDMRDTSVTIWCPLVDVDTSNGTLFVVPKSHKLLPHIEGPNSPSYFSNFTDSIYDHMIPLRFAAGNGVIFDDGLVHGSPPNHSNAPRIAVQICCVPHESKPVFFYNHHDGTQELITGDQEFYLENDVADLLVCQPHWRSCGFIADPNRMLGADEFATMLKNNEKLRAKFMKSELPIFDQKPVPHKIVLSTEPSLWRRALAKFRRALRKMT